MQLIPEGKSQQWTAGDAASTFKRRQGGRAGCPPRWQRLGQWSGGRVNSPNAAPARWQLGPAEIVGSRGRRRGDDWRRPCRRAKAILREAVWPGGTIRTRASGRFEKRPRSPARAISISGESTRCELPAAATRHQAGKYWRCALSGGFAIDEAKIQVLGDGALVTPARQRVSRSGRWKYSTFAPCAQVAGADGVQDARDDRCSSTTRWRRRGRRRSVVAWASSSFSQPQPWKFSS